MKRKQRRDDDILIKIKSGKVSKFHTSVQSVADFFMIQKSQYFNNLGGININ